jgi:hypothetical protein
MINTSFSYFTSGKEKENLVSEDSDGPNTVSPERLG